MSHSIVDHRLPEVGERRQATLVAAGFGTLEAIAAAEPREVAGLAGMHLPLALRTISRAVARLEELGVVGVDVVEPGVDEASAGLPGSAAVASEICKLLKRLPKAQRHAGTSNLKRARKRARVALTQFGDRLQRIQRRIERGKFSEANAPKVRRVLKAMHRRLGRFIDRRPKRSRLAKLRRQVEAAAHSLRL